MHGTWWSTMVMCTSTMVRLVDYGQCHGISWSTMVMCTSTMVRLVDYGQCHGISWHFMVDHGHVQIRQWVNMSTMVKEWPWPVPWYLIVDHVCSWSAIFTIIDHGVASSVNNIGDKPHLILLFSVHYMYI